MVARGATPKGEHSEGCCGAWRRAIACALIPGWYDLRYSSPLRGLSVLFLTGFVMWLLMSGGMRWIGPGSVGMFSKTALPGPLTFPLPPGLSTLDLYLVPSHAKIFYASAIASLLAVIVLHVSRFGAIRELGRRPVDGTEGLETATLRMEGAGTEANP